MNLSHDNYILIFSYLDSESLEKLSDIYSFKSLIKLTLKRNEKDIYYYLATKNKVMVLNLYPRVKFTKKILRRCIKLATLSDNHELFSLFFDNHTFDQKTLATCYNLTYKIKQETTSIRCILNKYTKDRCQCTCFKIYQDRWSWMSICGCWKTVKILNKLKRHDEILKIIKFTRAYRKYIPYLLRCDYYFDISEFPFKSKYLRSILTADITDQKKPMIDWLLKESKINLRLALIYAKKSNRQYVTDWFASNEQN